MDSTQLQLTFQQLEAPVLADLKNNDVVPALLGPPGIGKSEFLKALARKKHTKVFVLSMNQLADRADLTGARLLKDEKTNTYGQFFFPHATIMEAIEYAKNRPNEEPILFLDEFNRTTSDVTSATMTFITERRVGTTDFPENLRMVIAGNDQGNVVNIDDASVTRIVVYHAQPDTETFLNVNPDINPFIRDVLIKNPTYLTSDKNKDYIAEANDDIDEDDEQSFDLSLLDDSSQFEQLTVPRTISKFSKWLNIVGITQPLTPEGHQFITDATMTGETHTPLFKMFIAHAGHTPFTTELYNNVMETVLSQNVQVTQTVLSNPYLNYRNDSLINQIVHSQDMQVIEDDISNLAKMEQIKLLMWLSTIEAQQELNDNQLLERVILTTLTALENVGVTSLDNESNKYFTENILKDIFPNKIFMSYVRANQTELMKTLESIVNLIQPNAA